MDGHENNNEHEQGGVVEQKPNSTPVWKKQWFIILIVSILVVLIAGFAIKNVRENALPEGQVIAIVGSEKIFQKEVDSRLAQITKQGVQDPSGFTPTEEEVLENLINETLILQAASDVGIAITNEQVEDVYTNQVLAGFENEEALKTHLSGVGLTIERVKEDILTQLIIQEYILQNTPAIDIAVSEEEVRSFYDELGVEGAEMPPFEEVREQIIGHLEQEKQALEFSGVVESLVADLRLKTEIEIITQ